MYKFDENFLIKPKVIKKLNPWISRDKYVIDDIFQNQEDCLLITGQVQSGKTKHIIEIIKEAITKYKFNLIIVLGGYNNKLLNQTQERFEKELKDINTKDSKAFEFQTVKWNNKIEMLFSNNIYNVLKNIENIKHLLTLIKNIKFKNSRILFIDDEADFFSIKNQKNSNDSKKIYDYLKEIYNNIKTNFPNSLYINVTATPYANIINNYDNDFGVNALYSLPINDEYKGYNYFQENKEKHFIIDENLFFTKDDNQKYINVITFWLMLSILYFKNNGNESELIIFNDINKEEHKKIENIIKNKILYNKEFFIKSFYEIKEKYSYLKGINESNFLEMLCYIQDNLEDSIIVLNSENNIENNSSSKLKIYIGGILLSRGLTFKNLILEYFGYDSNMTYDTLLQRCRWFGYRNNILDYMKIICKNTIIENLNDCSKCVDFFFNSETINGAKFKLKETRDELANIKKITLKK